MDIIVIYLDLFDQNMGMAFVKARFTHILIFFVEMQLSVVKSRSALSPLASCCSLPRLFCDKMGVEPNWRIYRTTIARAQKPVKYPRAYRM